MDYDFEEKMTPLDTRSFVFRKLMSQHILHYYISRRIAFSVNYKLELEENGKLFWNEWTEMIITTRQNHYTNIYFDVKLFPGSTFSLGAVLFKRNAKLNIVDSSESSSFSNNNNYISYGPSIKINYIPHSKLNLSFSGIRRVLDRRNQQDYFINNINVNLLWYM